MPFAVRASFAARIYCAVRASFVARACLVGWGLSLSGAVLRCPVLSCAARCCPALPGAARYCPVLPCAARRRLTVPSVPTARPCIASCLYPEPPLTGAPGAVRRCGICPCNRQRPGRSGSRWRSAPRSCAAGSQPGLLQKAGGGTHPEQRPGMFAGGYGIDGGQRVVGSRPRRMPDSVLRPRSGGMRSVCAHGSRSAACCS